MGFSWHSRTLYVIKKCTEQSNNKGPITERHSNTTSVQLRSRDAIRRLIRRKSLSFLKYVRTHQMFSFFVLVVVCPNHQPPVLHHLISSYASLNNYDDLGRHITVNVDTGGTKLLARMTLSGVLLARTAWQNGISWIIRHHSCFFLLWHVKMSFGESGQLQYQPC